MGTDKKKTKNYSYYFVNEDKICNKKDDRGFNKFDKIISSKKLELRNKILALKESLKDVNRETERYKLILSFVKDNVHDKYDRIKLLKELVEMPAIKINGNKGEVETTNKEKKDNVTLANPGELIAKLLYIITNSDLLLEREKRKDSKTVCLKNLTLVDFLEQHENNIKQKKSDNIKNDKSKCKIKHNSLENNKVSHQPSTKCNDIDKMGLKINSQAKLKQNLFKNNGKCTIKNIHLNKRNLQLEKFKKQKEYDKFNKQTSFSSNKPNKHPDKMGVTKKLTERKRYQIDNTLKVIKEEGIQKKLDTKQFQNDERCCKSTQVRARKTFSSDILSSPSPIKIMLSDIQKGIEKLHCIQLSINNSKPSTREFACSQSLQKILPSLHELNLEIKTTDTQVSLLNEQQPTSEWYENAIIKPELGLNVQSNALILKQFKELDIEEKIKLHLFLKRSRAEFKALSEPQLTKFQSDLLNQENHLQSETKVTNKVLNLMLTNQTDVAEKKLKQIKIPANKIEITDQNNEAKTHHLNELKLTDTSNCKLKQKFLPEKKTLDVTPTIKQKICTKYYIQRAKSEPKRKQKQDLTFQSKSTKKRAQSVAMKNIVKKSFDQKRTTKIAELNSLTKINKSRSVLYNNKDVASTLEGNVNLVPDIKLKKILKLKRLQKCKQNYQEPGTEFHVATVNQIVQLDKDITSLEKEIQLTTSLQSVSQQTCDDTKSKIKSQEEITNQYEYLKSKHQNLEPYIAQELESINTLEEKIANKMSPLNSEKKIQGQINDGILNEKLQIKISDENNVSNEIQAITSDEQEHIANLDTELRIRLMESLLDQKINLLSDEQETEVTNILLEDDIETNNLINTIKINQEPCCYTEENSLQPNDLRDLIQENQSSMLNVDHQELIKNIESSEKIQVKENLTIVPSLSLKNSNIFTSETEEKPSNIKCELQVQMSQIKSNSGSKTEYKLEFESEPEFESEQEFETEVETESEMEIKGSYIHKQRILKIIDYVDSTMENKYKKKAPKEIDNKVNEKLDEIISQLNTVPEVNFDNFKTPDEKQETTSDIIKPLKDLLKLPTCTPHVFSPRRQKTRMFETLLDVMHELVNQKRICDFRKPIFYPKKHPEIERYFKSKENIKTKQLEQEKEVEEKIEDSTEVTDVTRDKDTTSYIDIRHNDDIKKVLSSNSIKKLSKNMPQEYKFDFTPKNIQFTGQSYNFKEKINTTNNFELNGTNQKEAITQVIVKEKSQLYSEFKKPIEENFKSNVCLQEESSPKNNDNLILNEAVNYDNQIAIETDEVTNFVIENETEDKKTFVETKDENVLKLASDIRILRQKSETEDKKELEVAGDIKTSREKSEQKITEDEVIRTAMQKVREVLKMANLEDEEEYLKKLEINYSQINFGEANYKSVTKRANKKPECSSPKSSGLIEMRENKPKTHITKDQKIFCDLTATKQSFKVNSAKRKKPKVDFGILTKLNQIENSNVSDRTTRDCGLDSMNKIKINSGTSCDPIQNPHNEDQPSFHKQRKCKCGKHFTREEMVTRPIGIVTELVKSLNDLKKVHCHELKTCGYIISKEQQERICGTVLGLMQELNTDIKPKCKCEKSHHRFKAFRQTSTQYENDPCLTIKTRNQRRRYENNNKSLKHTCIRVYNNHDSISDGKNKIFPFENTSISSNQFQRYPYGIAISSKEHQQYYDRETTKLKVTEKEDYISMYDHESTDLNRHLSSASFEDSEKSLQNRTFKEDTKYEFIKNVNQLKINEAKNNYQYCRSKLSRKNCMFVQPNYTDSELDLKKIWGKSPNNFFQNLFSFHKTVALLPRRS